VTQFDKWCTAVTTPVGNWELKVLTADPGQINFAVKAISEAIPGQYTSEDRLADIMRKLGKAKTAKVIETSLPSSNAVRSGDLGEVLGVTYLAEVTEFKLHVKRLRWKDHRNMAMRGEDILAFAVNDEGNLLALKGEAKSRKVLTATTIRSARKALAANNGRPSAHAMAFMATRYFEMGDQVMTDLLDRAQLDEQLSQDRVTHMIFILSGNDPTKQLTQDLSGYKGAIKQISVGVVVATHQEFIKSVFEEALENVL
jgi:hypothetical protein